MDSATADHACVWCKCPKAKYHDMDSKWLISNPVQGATVEVRTKEIKVKA